jgi:hypothetical protein
MQYITADFNTLMRQASMTADDYIGEAIHRIDRHLGDGYAASHPELIGSFIQTAAIDFATSIIGQRIEYVADVIEGAAARLSPSTARGRGE